MSRKTTLILISIGILCVLFVFYINVFGIKVNNKANPKLTAKDKLQAQDFQIAGLRLEQPIEEVIKILGKPIKIKTILNGFNGCDEMITIFLVPLLLYLSLGKMCFS
jgi:hypothetical protein